MPVVLGATVVGCFFGILALPDRLLATRDFAFFHLPLRLNFARLLGEGVPYWNPWIHAGQPLLSNPSYGAFYPLSWIVLVCDPGYALGWQVLLHGGIAFGGAWYLARRLGCGSGAAALAAIAYTGAGAFLSLLHAYTMFGGMAWFPWILAAGDALAAAGPFRWRPALAAGGALAMQLLNGEPTTALLGGLALVAFVVRGPLSPPGLLRSVARVAVPVVLALILAAPQLLATGARLADSPRQEALDVATATVWSAPPERLVELMLPRAFGDPVRWEEGLYFGSDLHDRQFPYLLSIYPGLLVALLAIAALWRGCPRRNAWLAMLAGGLFLGLGHHNPVYPWLHEHLPLLGRLRYPEKFLLLALAALPFVAALGWQRLLDQRGRGEERLPLVLTLVAAAVALLVAVVFWLGPNGLSPWVVSGSLAVASAAAVSEALGFLARQHALTVGVAVIGAAILWCVRLRRVPAAALSAALALLVGGDLLWTGSGLVRTLPAADLARPPAAIAPFLPLDSRLFVDELFHPLGGGFRRDAGPRPGLAYEYTKTARLDPYVGNLWDVPYALHADYDLMLTEWGRHGLHRLRLDASHTVRTAALLGAWNVGYLILRGAEPEAPVEVRENGWALPRYRFVPRVHWHRERQAAVDAQRAGAMDYRALDHWIVPAGAGLGERVEERPEARITWLWDRGSRIELDYEAAAPGGFLVIASTFDDHWRASVDGEVLTVVPTALGQIGVVAPPGAHRLELSFRDPMVDLGVVIGLLAWGILAPLIWWRGGRSSAPVA